ncbi:TonB-dependent receptor [Brevundimonas aurantiaca]|uniref:TonB-dependent receptor n=1 Tax=Brevundimonas aurantiaca TaxID=74316 RepID=UPI001D186167|nr:TonB-dependent receptor [Brevundimonas aurantiaca]MCC4293220.1 TonB-dependent receptor [Brevundimonas aurantiaca]
MKNRSIRQRMLATTMMGGVAFAMIVAAPVLTPTAALAQSTTGGLRVTVNGPDGAPLAGATVTVSSPLSLVSRTGVTDSAGFVRLSGLDPAANYTVTISAPNYETFTATGIAVTSNSDLSQTFSIGGASTVDDIIVTGTSFAAVDVTSATVQTVLTLDTVESLPTGRSYQSYLQLVPGVKPGSNPSSKSGINSSVTGVVGSSSDNVYYIDGVNVTDPVTGTFGANLNNEIIQEQKVITGGAPAEYEGGSGLISQVVTKSGSNEFHGSVNYYFQNDSLVQEDKHNESAGFSTYDTAVTLGGPILRDRLWFFGSYQRTHREDDVLNRTTGAVQRTVERDAEYGFAKLTWQITDNDRLTATYLSDPTEISGSSSASVRNYRDSATDQGGERYKIDYTKTWGDLTLNAYYFNHESELNTIAADSSTRNNVVFARGATYTYEEQNIGGSGGNTLRNRNRDEWGVSAEYFLDTSFGSHTFKAGYTSTKNENIVEGTVNGGATYTSLSSRYPGTTFAQLAGTGFTSAVFSADDRSRIIDGINAASNRAALYAIVDTNRDGSLSLGEIDAISFSDTAGNPGSQINSYRSLRTQNGINNVGSEGKAFYIQDSWTKGQLTVNAGVRAEEWTHTDSNGSELFTFEWELAPRVSVVYDLFGDGRTKVWAFGGRYYDPVRNDMTAFAGSLSGAVDEEQINIGGNWVTYRTRGGAAVLDSIFSPSTKTPYTDEFLIGYSTTFGRDIGLSVVATQRNTRNIFEDYDLHVYSDPTNTGLDGNAVPGGPFFLDYSYFGLSAAQIADVQAGRINYVLGTLAGGKRDYRGIEVALTKYRTENWFGQLSYTFNDAKGNSSSDGNAGVQGDFIYLDPRAPNAWGDLPGNIKHQFKAYGGYEFDFGLEVAGVFNWNSGVIYTPISYLYGYVAGPRDPAYNFGGTTSTWLSPGFTGSETGPSYFTFDVRATYTLDLSFGKVELFADIFNILDQQSATSEFTDVAGNADFDYQEANAWVAPRRAYLGVRYSF